MLEIRFYPGADARPDVPKRWPQVPCPVDAAAGERIVVHCKRKVDAGCEVYLIRSAGVLGQTATVLERMRVEADAVAPVEQSVGVLPFEGVLADGGVPTELARAASGFCSNGLCLGADGFAIRAMTRSVRCDGGARRSVPRRRYRADARLCSVPGVWFAATWGRWRWPASWARRLTWRRRCSARIGPRLPGCAGLARGGYTCLPSCSAMTGSVLPSWLLNPASWGLFDADCPELMVCEHCLLTAEGACATDATGQVRCRDCSRRRQARYLVERDGTRLPVAIDACGRTRIFLS